jgi:hypothetical protein
MVIHWVFWFSPVSTIPSKFHSLPFIFLSIHSPISDAVQSYQLIVLFNNVSVNTSMWWAVQIIHLLVMRFFYILLILGFLRPKYRSLSAILTQLKSSPFGIYTTIELTNVSTTSHNTGTLLSHKTPRQTSLLSDVVAICFQLSHSINSKRVSFELCHYCIDTFLSIKFSTTLGLW